MSLLELLCAVLILLLVTLGMTTGIRLGVDRFAKSMRISEAKILYSTISTVMAGELRYTADVTVDAAGNVVDFQAVNFGKKQYAQSPPCRNFYSMEEDGTPTESYGEIGYGTETSAEDMERILGSAAYNYGLTAKVDRISYDDSKGIFTVGLSIGYKGESYLSQEFQVLNIGAVKAKVR